ncbi:MAG: glycosyltransferase family 4 protein [Actinobacteria bacterium]|nr:glycosyltransferase family 4 protein [Actinomycetota bacterium]MBE3114659.1 glycosyltransferase family 4 protein [Actinomycetota bacterium]
MKIGIFNTQGINKTEHFIPLEIEELKKRGHEVELYWVKGRHPTKDEAESMSFAIFHFVPTAYHFCNIGVPFCILPTAHDIFLDNGRMLLAIEKHPNYKFIGYQSFYHKRKYEEWGVTKPMVHIPHAVRTSLFKRDTPYNPLGKIIAGGRLIPKKGLDRLKSVENLTIFGDGPLKESLKSQMAGVNLTGYLTGSQLKDLFEESSIYLFPAIITPDNDSEGISNTIKEAMLMELQVICTPIAGNVEFEGVAFLSDWSKEGIENAISCMPREANTKGRIEILKNFSPEVCVNKLINAINEYGNVP